MSHVIEPAASGRAKCRGCGNSIAKGELRLGERLPNPFGDGDMTLWFHPGCGAYKRPEPFLEALEDTPERDAVEPLRSSALIGTAHRRLPRLDGGSRAPTGRARCRSCREMIEKDSWRIGLVYYEEGYFNPSGFIHAGCARDYFEAPELDAEALIERVRQFSPKLSCADLEEIGAQVGSARG